MKSCKLFNCLHFFFFSFQRAKVSDFSYPILSSWSMCFPYYLFLIFACCIAWPGSLPVKYLTNLVKSVVLTYSVLCTVWIAYTGNLGHAVHMARKRVSLLNKDFCGGCSAFEINFHEAWLSVISKSCSLCVLYAFDMRIQIFLLYEFGHLAQNGATYPCSEQRTCRVFLFFCDRVWKFLWRLLILVSL